MTVAMRLTTKTVDLRNADDTPENIAIEGALVVKGTLSDLTKIMEAIKLGHLHPFVEPEKHSEPVHMMMFCELATQEKNPRYSYPNGDLNKIECIKAIRSVLNTGLKETKDFVEGSIRLYIPENLIVDLRNEGIVLLHA